MLMLTYLAFAITTVSCVLLQLLVHKLEKLPSVGNNPTFLQFQRKYFTAYLLAVFADWLQGPYLYKLYSHYGFMEEQIAVLYVVGFASAVILGTWAPIAADRFGRRKLCVFFTIIYSVSCFLKLSWNYGILLLGRILSGVATSTLFYSFDAWYVYEHIETNDFPREWIAVTMNKATAWNGFLAIAAGVVAQIFAEVFSLGPVSPFMLAVPCLGASGVIIMLMWKENYGTKQVKFGKACKEGLKNIVTEPRIFLIGIIQSLFESVLYIFVFLWTPVLLKGRASIGVVFSTFMICIQIGSALFRVQNARRVPVPMLLLLSIIMALAANVICIVSNHPDRPLYSLSFLAFLLFEIGVGIYFPAMGFIRSRIIPDKHRTSIMNWFRVPLNLIACVVLMLLHDDHFKHGNRLIFAVCTGLLGVGLMLMFKFVSLVKDDEDLKQELSSYQEGQVQMAG